MHKILLIVLLLSITHVAYAKSPYQQHCLDAAQTLSAFYMYRLADQGEKFKLDVIKFNLLATESAKQAKKSSSTNQRYVLARWLSISNLISVHVSQQADFMEESTRLMLRRYLTDLYLQIANIDDSKYPHGKGEMASIYIAILAARAFDLSSSSYGSADTDDYDSQLDLEYLVGIVHEYLTHKEAELTLASEHRSMRKLLTKFNFVTHNFLHYREQFLYFVAYKNTQTIIGTLQNNIYNFNGEKSDDMAEQSL